MYHFRKHLGICMIRLLLSEILCLILAISFAILRASFLINMLGLVCGLTAHILLMQNCAAKIADADAKEHRVSGKQISVRKPLLLSAALTVPAFLTYLILCIRPDSILWLNLFPLLNAPFLQIHHFLIAGTEPFSAIPLFRRMLMALPPLITGIAFFSSYQMRYLSKTAQDNAMRSR